MGSEQHIPGELPDLRRVGLLAIDSEEKDNGLATDRGSGWPWRDGHVCGISVAYRADGHLHGFYFPMRHPDTQNFAPEQVYAWLKDHVAADLRFITHNGPFDWGWFRAEAGIRMPPSARLEELGALATLTNENRRDFGLDALAKSCGFAGKDECLLREGCATLDLITNKRKKFRPQTYLWQLPARYVAAYAASDAINTLLVHEHFDLILDKENTRAAYRLECDLLPLIVEMRARGIRIDVAAAKRARDLLLGKRDTALAQLSDRLGTPVGMDELNRAKWKAEIFEREKVAYPRTEKNNPNFSGDWMKGHAHWLPQLICEAEKYHRAGDRFIDKFILGHTVNGRIHAEIHPFQTEEHGTKSFRFSYSDPPLQQMSARDEEFAPIIRGLFLPEEGEVWAKPDASQQEFRITVHYAAVHNMPKVELAALRYCDDPNTDFHLLTAQTTGLERKDAKAVNFAKIYGAGVRKFAEMTGLPLNKARELYTQYDREMPFLRALSKAYEQLARQQGYITLYDGARRHFNLWVPAGKWEKGAGPCEREEAERRLTDPKHKWFNKGQLYRADCHNALNALVQGTAARHTKLWMRACWREGIVPLLQMHDCLDCSVATREQAETVAQLCVEAVQLKVPMCCDLKFGRTWGDAKHSWAELCGEPAVASIATITSGSTSSPGGAPTPDPIDDQLEPVGEATMGAYAQCAEELIALGYAAVPIMGGTKAPGFFCAGLWVPLPAWQRRFLDKTPSQQQRALWSKGETGIGVVGGRASHGLIGVDVDTDDSAIKPALMQVLPKSPVRKIGAKGETAFYYGPDIAASRSWNIDSKRVCDLIADGRQTVLPPTMHPDGVPYRWLEQPLAAFKPEELPRLPADICDQIDAVLRPLGWEPDAPRPGNGFDDADDASPHRQLNDFAMEHLKCWVPKLQLYKCRPARGGYEAVAHWRPSSSGRELELRKRNLSIVPKGIKDFGDGRKGGTGFTYTPLDLVMAASDCDLDTAFKFLSEATGWAKGIWIDELASVTPTAGRTPQMEPPPVSPTEPQAQPQAESVKAKLDGRGTSADPDWPILDAAAYHGLAGDVVRALLPNTEADPAALLLQYLTYAGNMIGRKPFYRQASVNHYPNLFAIIAGRTARARKGTSAQDIRTVMESADPSWVRDNIKSGISSGEGIIEMVRDARFKTQQNGVQVCIAAPVIDKRLLLDEREFSSALNKMKQQTNIVSEVLRKAWDCIPPVLSTSTKHDASVATEPLISLVAHITLDELRQRLDSLSITNGFGNRFLYSCVDRSKLLAHGGNHDPAVINALGARTRRAVTAAQALGRMTMTAEATALWEEIYYTIEQGALTHGLIDHITTRAAPQTLRLAMIYALLDGSAQIGPPHLMAAKALWQFCENSARYVFDNVSADRITDMILWELEDRRPDGISRMEFIRDVFGGHVRVYEILQALRKLAELGKVRREKKKTPGSGRGRPPEVWFAV